MTHDEESAGQRRPLYDAWSPADGLERLGRFGTGAVPSIVGTLTDETGAVVPGAVVTVKNTSRGLSREATTDETGHYAIQNLLEGVYDLSVNASGFKPYTQTGVEVSINSVTRADIRVQVGAITDQVTVEGSSQVLQTTKSDVSTHLDTEALENLPLSNYRNYQSLINLVPGATPAAVQTRSPTPPGAR